MKIKIDVDTSGKTPDLFLAMIYSWNAGGVTFTYTGTGGVVQAIVDGAKDLSLEEYNSLKQFPYVPDFAEPPIPPSS